MEYEYDPSDDVYSGHHDFESPYSLGTSVVMLIEAVEETEVRAVTPLYDAIDSEALDRLFRPRRRTHRNDGSVRFVLGDYEITVFADGDIELRIREVT